MAETKILQGAKITLTLGATTITQGTNVATDVAVFPGVTDDVTSHPDEVRIDLEYTGGTVGEAASMYAAGSNAAGTFIEGNVTAQDVAVPDSSLPNLGVPGTVISQAANPSAGSAVLRMTHTEFIVVVRNDSAASITVTSLSATPLTYESV